MPTLFLDTSPCPEPLRTALLEIMEHNGIRRDEVECVERIEHARVSSNYSNVISCGLSGGRVLRLFAKYSQSSSEEGHGGSGHGHWGGVAYEAEVYHRVLRHSTLTSPKFYGEYRDEATGQFCFFIEYVEGGWFVSSQSNPRKKMGRAASWLGRFHAENERRAAEHSWPFLKRYDTDYYLGWARRTSQFAGDLHRRYPWLAPLCMRFGEAVTTLQQSPLTVVHGEFYPHNVLYLRGSIFPLDWESAAVASGEIDLAALTEGWSEEMIDSCFSEYVSSRWPVDSSRVDSRWFTAARLFLQFRWLGDQPEWAVDPENFHRYDQMRELATRLRLI